MPIMVVTQDVAAMLLILMENLRIFFEFSHPYSDDPAEIRKWAEDWIREELGEEHVKDLDWENCHIVDD